MKHQFGFPYYENLVRMNEEVLGDLRSIRFEEALPKTQTGKIQRFRLRETGH